MPSNIQKGDIRNGRLSIRKAQIEDVKRILELVNYFAASNLMLPRGPQYIYENIRDFVVAVESKDSDSNTAQSDDLIERFLGCGSLHVLWRDLAEVRALAIASEYQHMGIGKAIVDFIIQESRELYIKSLYTFTMSTKFFTEMGFKVKGKEGLRPKLWGECSRCPKFFNCDEIGMVLEL